MSRAHNALSLSIERRTIAARDAQGAVVLTKLPMPPPANNLFLNAPGKGRVRSARYRQWAQSAGWQIRAQRPARLRGPVEITLTFEEGATRADIDNLAKAPIDLLVALALIESDDAYVVRQVTLRWGQVAGLEVRIQPATASPRVVRTGAAP